MNHSKEKFAQQNEELRQKALADLEKTVLTSFMNNLPE